MNYVSLYNAFLADRLSREPSLLTYGAYYERHHMKPRAFGGDDTAGNIIALTPADHLFSHLLLAKIYGGTMLGPLIMMLDNTKYSGRRSRRRYATLRAAYQAELSKTASAYWSDPAKREAHAVKLRGRRHTEDAKRAIGVAHRGIKFTDIALENIRAANCDPERRAALSLALTGRVMTDEHRAKLSAAWTPARRAAQAILIAERNRRRT